VIHRFVQNGRPANSLVDNRRRHLALTETGHVDLLADRFVRLVQLRLELFEGHLDGELDPRWAQAFGAAFHVRLLHLNVATLVAGLWLGCPAAWFTADQAQLSIVSGPSTRFRSRLRAAVLRVFSWTVTLPNDNR